MQHACWSTTSVKVPVWIPAEKFKQLILHLAEVIELYRPMPHPTLRTTTPSSLNWGGLYILHILKGHILDIATWQACKHISRIFLESLTATEPLSLYATYASGLSSISSLSSSRIDTLLLLPLNVKRQCYVLSYINSIFN